MLSAAADLPSRYAMPQWPATALVQWVEVTPVQLASSWLSPSLRALSELEALATNWDGYGSPRITREALTSARMFLHAIAQADLPAPEVVPVTGGGIGIVFHSPDRELEVEALPDGSMTYLLTFRDISTGDEREEAGVVRIGHVAPCIPRLAGWMATPDRA